MTFDVERAREQTPGCSTIAHLNNAAASLMPSPVIQEVTNFLYAEAQWGAYEAAARNQSAISRPYTALATLLGCSVEEIALCDSATRAWATVFYALSFRKGDRILFSGSEYANNHLILMRAARELGIEIEAIPDDETGQTSVEALRSMLDERVRLVTITHVPTHGGLVNPAEEIGTVLRSAGIPYVLDAAQSVGQMPLNVSAIGCDFLIAPGRKYLRGPRGTGFIYASKKWHSYLDPAGFDWAACKELSVAGYSLVETARRLESGEASMALRAGLGTAVEYALEWGIPAIQARINFLAERLRLDLGSVPNVKIEDMGVNRCGIVTFSVEGNDPEELYRTLLESGINIKLALRQSSFHDMDRRGLEKLCRASVHYFNTEEELARLCEVVASQQ